MDHAGPAAQLTTSLKPKWLTLTAVAVLTGLVLRTAWVTDDSYITLRTVHNLVSGYGLRWNPGERVQSFTHPLWLLFLTIPYALTRHAFFSALIAGVTTTLLALLMLVKSARSAGHAFVAVSLLLLSRSFVEYSTSGLENPLTHLLVALFVWAYVTREAGLRNLTLCASLLALNRIDALIVTLPALGHAALVSLRSHGPRQTVRALAIGGAPLLAWEAFSLFYYGALVPNTALAKLNTGLSLTQLAPQGFVYVLDTLAWDPPLLVVVGAAITLGFAQRRARPALAALGTLLYVLYVVRIGGDFMIGRFMTLPLFMGVSVIAVSPLPLEEPGKSAWVFAPFLLLFFHPSALERYPVGDFHHNGIADERIHYRDQAALMMLKRDSALPNHVWASEGRAARLAHVKVMLHENIGFLGYAAGPGVHIIDINALSEPLLARLPPYYTSDWRIGHYLRHVPEGYLETVKSGVCQMPDKNLCQYYANLREVVSGNLFSFSRLKKLVLLNLGAYERLIDWDRYRHPGLLRERLSALTAHVAEGAAFDSAGTQLIQSGGLEVELGRVWHARRLRISFDGNDGYEVMLKRDGKLIESLTSPSADIGAMHTRELIISEDHAEQGYDRLLIVPKGGDGKYSVGFIRLLAQ